MMDDPINAPSAAVTGSLLLSPPHFPTGCVPYTKKKKKMIFPSLFYTHFTPKENGTEKEPRGGKKRTHVRSPFYIWRKGNRRDTRLSIVLPLTAGSISQTHSSLHWPLSALDIVGVKTFCQRKYREDQQCLVRGAFLDRYAMFKNLNLEQTTVSRVMDKHKRWFDWNLGTASCVNETLKLKQTDGWYGLKGIRKNDLRWLFNRFDSIRGMSPKPRTELGSSNTSSFGLKVKTR